MNKKFIRIISPFSFVTIAALDISVIAFSAYAVIKLSENANAYTIIFAIIDLIAILTAFFASKEVLSNGVCFRENEVEFTGIDNDNIFRYDDIIKVEAQRDTSVSFRKNFVDRYSILTLYLKDDSIVSIQLGVTTGKTLNKVKNNIEERIK